MNQKFCDFINRVMLAHPSSHEVNYSEGIDICSFFGILSS